MMFRKNDFILPATLIFAAGTLFAQDSVPSGDVPVIVAPAKEEAVYSTTQGMKIETRLTAYFLEGAHILQKKIAQMDMGTLIESDCLALDYSRTFFLQSDVDALKARFAPTLSDYIARGNLHAAFTIYKKFSERLEQRVAWIEKRLQKPELFDLSRTDSVKLNRKDEKWPATQTEADELWEQRLTFELISQIFSAEEEKKAKTETVPAGKNSAEKTVPAETGATVSPTSEAVAAACEKLKKRYKNLRTNFSLEPWEVEEFFLNALGGLYDPHTSFFSKQTMEEFEIMMRNSLCGIGAVLMMDDGYCTIREIIPGSPVERSGKFSVGDRIVAIGDDSAAELTDVVNMRLNRIVRMLRGKKGVPVRLLVESGNDHSRQLITLERDDVKLTEQLASAQIIDVPAPAADAPSVPVGVIRLPSFYGKDRSAATSFSTAEDVKELLLKLKKAGVKAIVLDLRNNGGGYLNEAIDLIELFVGPGVPALQTKDFNGKISTLPTGGTIGIVKNIFSDTPEWTGPVVVLVSKLSASASEIVAGALQDNRRAIILGDPHTHGKGSVQEVIPFSQYYANPDASASQGASIKLTRSKWYSPSGNSIQIKGVSADIPAPTIYSVLPVGEGDLDRPLQWDSISSALGDLKTPAWAEAPISPELVAILGEKSRRRQAELPEFLTHNRIVSWRAEREKDKTYPLGIEARNALKNEDKAFSDWAIKTYAQLEEKSAFPKTEIKLDSAVAQEKNSEEKSKNASAAKKSNALTGIPAQNSDGDDAEELPDFDVILRESARVAADWVSLLENRKADEKSAVPAK